MTDLQSSRPAKGDSTREERLEVLRLLESGDISAGEADALLEALTSVEHGMPRTADASTSSPRSRPGNVRVRITDVATGRPNLNIALPLVLVEAGLNVARRFAPDKVPSTESIRQSIASGMGGTLVDVIDKNDRIEVIVEP